MSQAGNQREGLLAAYFVLVSYLAYSLTLKMEAISSSEPSVKFQRTMLRYIPEDRILHNHRCENLVSYTLPILTANKHTETVRILSHLCSPIWKQSGLQYFMSKNVKIETYKIIILP
jgi:hypothetical protein